MLRDEVGFLREKFEKSEVRLIEEEKEMKERVKEAKREVCRVEDEKKEMMKEV